MVLISPQEIGWAYEGFRSAPIFLLHCFEMDLGIPDFRAEPEPAEFLGRARKPPNSCVPRGPNLREFTPQVHFFRA